MQQNVQQIIKVMVENKYRCNLMTGFILAATFTLLSNLGYRTVYDSNARHESTARSVVDNLRAISLSDSTLNYREITHRAEDGVSINNHTSSKESRHSQNEPKDSLAQHAPQQVSPHQASPQQVSRHQVSPHQVRNPHVEFLNVPERVPSSVTCNKQYVCTISKSGLLTPDPSTDVAIFLGWQLPESPPRKPPDQLWVMRTWESQRSQSVDMATWDGYFNYSFTLRRDSDRPDRWSGKLVPLKNKTFRNFAKERKWKGSYVPTAVWFVSNCRTNGIYRVTSARVSYAVELSQWIDLSTFTQNEECETLIQQLAPSVVSLKPKDQQPPVSDFHFYLAFENSLCTDYITEKFWKILRRRDLVIPIVMGGLEMEEYERIAPPNSYIHVKNFTSPKHLAEHLKYIVKHEEAFNYYLQWRNEYQLYTDGDSNLCRYCILAHQRPQKVWNNISQHFNQSQCIDVTDRDRHCRYYGISCVGKE